MDEFDEAILDALIDGKQHSFNQLLEKADFTQHTQAPPGQTRGPDDRDEGKGHRGGSGEAILRLLVEFRGS